MANLLVSQPDCGEDALTIAETPIRSGAIDLVVVDSVAALVPKSESEGQMTMGDAGRTLTLLQWRVKLGLSCRGLRVVGG